jgi:hypothetical protein
MTISTILGFSGQAVATRDIVVCLISLSLLYYFLLSLNSFNNLDPLDSLNGLHRLHSYPFNILGH